MLFTGVDIGFIVGIVVGTAVGVVVRRVVGPVPAAVVGGVVAVISFEGFIVGFWDSLDIQPAQRKMAIKRTMTRNSLMNNNSEV